MSDQSKQWQEIALQGIETQRTLRIRIEQLEAALIEIRYATFRNTLLQGFKHTDADKAELNSRLDDIRRIIVALAPEQDK